jgi:hypothetical protein
MNFYEWKKIIKNFTSVSSDVSSECERAILGDSFKMILLSFVCGIFLKLLEKRKTRTENEKNNYF